MAPRCGSSLVPVAARRRSVEPNARSAALSQAGRPSAAARGRLGSSGVTRSTPVGTFRAASLSSGATSTTGAVHAHHIVPPRRRSAQTTTHAHGASAATRRLESTGFDGLRWCRVRVGPGRCMRAQLENARHTLRAGAQPVRPAWCESRSRQDSAASAVIRIVVPVRPYGAATASPRWPAASVSVTSPLVSTLRETWPRALVEN
jgi:hypothetical protein